MWYFYIKKESNNNKNQKQRKMRRTSLAPQNAYNEADIRNSVSGLTTVRRGGNIITKNNGQVISAAKLSKGYEIVDFKDAVNLMLDVVGNIFSPNKYSISTLGGVQELKISGAEHTINGEVFHEMLWLTNSTDGSKRLSVRYGLMRQICSNGMCITLKGESLKVKHLKVNKVNKSMVAFFESLPALNCVEEIKVLNKLAKKEITVRSLMNKIVNETGTKGNDTIWSMFTKKLASSKTDRLGSLGTAEDALAEGINVPFQEMTKETLDAKIPAWTVLNCYTELWRARDASHIERETTKIVAMLA